jgi:DNA invertase Pin-like site-specific DNA recombinase
MKRAVAYVSDIILGRTGEVIKRSYQAETIRKFAADNDIEVVAWFEDEMYNEDVLMRPGIQDLLACEVPCELLLCERVWALSRSMPVLEAFFKELDRRHLRLECATTMWDCVSQKCRRRFRPGAAARPMPRAAVSRAGFHAVRVARPARLKFTGIPRHHPKFAH